MALSIISGSSDHTLSSITDDMITALTLQLEDLESESGSDGDHDPIHPDRELALATYRRDIQNFVNSHRAIHDIESEEHQTDSSSTTSSQDTTSWGSEDESLPSWGLLRYGARPEGGAVPRPGGRMICVVCEKLPHQSDRTEDTLEVLACGHVYCNECVHHMVATAAKSEISYPARCCGQIVDNDFLDRVLTREAYDQYLNAGVEFSSPRRLYCANTNCLKFIPDTVTGVGRSVRCRACNSHTCHECRELQHDGRCIQTEETRQLRTLVREKGWQNCSRCGRAIELTEGCDHMTCVCGHQFCYSCGVDYQDCVCKGMFGDGWSEDGSSVAGWRDPYRASGWGDPYDPSGWGDYHGGWGPEGSEYVGGWGDDDDRNREARRQNRERRRQNRERDRRTRDRGHRHADQENENHIVLEGWGRISLMAPGAVRGIIGLPPQNPNNFPRGDNTGARGSDTESSSSSDLESVSESTTTSSDVWNGNDTRGLGGIPCGTYILGPDGLIDRRVIGNHGSGQFRGSGASPRGWRSPSYI